MVIEDAHCSNLRIHSKQAKNKEQEEQWIINCRDQGAESIGKVTAIPSILFIIEIQEHYMNKRSFFYYARKRNPDLKSKPALQIVSPLPSYHASWGHE